MTRRELVGVLAAASIVSFGLPLSGCGGSPSPSRSNVGITLGKTGTFKGIPVGFTQQGYPYMGDADAPVTLEEFSDFLCPYCRRHFAQTLPTLVRDYVLKG